MFAAAGNRAPRTRLADPRRKESVGDAHPTCLALS